MNAFEMALAILFPALGGIGVWVTWNLAQDWIADRRARRQDPRRLDRPTVAGRVELPDTSRLSAEIERLG